jgi:hypothetical protein
MDNNETSLANAIEEALSPIPKHYMSKRIRKQKPETLSARAAEEYSVLAFKAGIVNFYGMSRLAWLLKKGVPKQD